ncbi:MAG: deoxyguanosinetriphosphate triphosphohydrolase [Flavobacteriales bacterium]|nr:MAG: deoxyguanosinetriphosphate triphosphohydrolase [Flavobacteriales bacterium]
MNWLQLLSLNKYGDNKPRLRIEQNETRLGFEVDYDRIIFSDSFRSLQDKTQVVPLSKTDFVHTRLTHSLEVSVVGRSLGRIAGRALLDKYPQLGKNGYKINDFGAIVAAASLAHDIGNPPFGHSGEKAIGEYFRTGKGYVFKGKLTPAQWQDLIDFEGNANGFKILTESRKGIHGGLRLTNATLGAFMKYPKESLPKKPTKDISDKKYGFFQANKHTFTAIAENLGLLKKEREMIAFHRHPLAFLVEAADDICYTIIDFEDGINLGLIDEDFALEYLINLVKNNLNIKKYNGLNTRQDRISYLRALAINNLINEAARIFIANEDAILRGEYNQALLKKCAYEAQINDIIKISVDKVYKSKEVVEKEISGYTILADLLDVFITAANNENNGTMTNYDALILSLYPKKYQQKNDNLYERLLSVCGFVAGMSDGAAILLHRKIKGFSI